MEAEKIKLAYSPNQLRVRVIFSSSVCIESELPPVNIMRRAQSKLEAEKRAGILSLYKVYSEEFSELWQKIRTQALANKDLKIDDIMFTIGCGAPELPKISIDPVTSEKMAFVMSIAAPTQEVRSWRFDFVRLNIIEQAEKLAINKKINWAQVYSCWLRAGRGERIINRPISIAPQAGNDCEKPYSIILNKSRIEVTLVIKSGKIFQDVKSLETMLGVCHESSKKLAGMTGAKVEFLQTQLVDRLKSALKGPEMFGMNLPAVYLVAFPTDVQHDEYEKPASSNAVSSASRVSRKPAPEKKSGSYAVADNYPGKGFLKFVVDAEKMNASIDGFDTKLYDHPEFSVSLGWVKLEMERERIVNGTSDGFFSELNTKIEKGEDLNGVTVAKGTVAVSAKQPYLFETYRHKEIKDSNGVVDIREMQQRSVVNAGDLVAEVRYKQPEIVGMDVYGETINPPPGEELSFTAGEGVEQKGLRFFASTDGLPKVENNVITLNRVLVHEGDVNLRTGNIRFEGSAEIKGAIDSGATVEVSGDLIVHGTIRDAFVRVGGTLDARLGIVTGGKGIVRAKNEILADFIENSKIICGGNISVKKAILNSKVVAGGDIQASLSDGVIAGGTYSCKKNLKTAKLGFPSGALTYVFAGIDWRAKLTLDIRQSRLEKIASWNEESRNALRELTRKKDGQKTKKHEAMLNEIQGRVQKIKRAMDRAKSMVDKANKEITFDSDSKIFVHGNLYTNCRIEVGGTAVPVVHEVIEVEITARRVRGSFINPITPEDGGASASGDGKKAS